MSPTSNSEPTTLRTLRGWICTLTFPMLLVGLVAFPPSGFSLWATTAICCAYWLFSPGRKN